MSDLTKSSFKNMRKRCKNPNDKSYKHYGGRGITCDAFPTFRHLIDAIGPRTSVDQELDRINSNGHYEPGNVRWATRSEQERNKRKTVLYKYRNKELPLRVWAKELGLSQGLLVYRIFEKGMSFEEAVTQPVRRGKKLDVAYNKQ